VSAVVLASQRIVEGRIIGIRQGAKHVRFSDGAMYGRSFGFKRIISSAGFFLFRPKFFQTNKGQFHHMRRLASREPRALNLGIVL
jgi:hypothetical protein